VTKFRVFGRGGSPQTRASKRATRLNGGYFAVIGSYSVKTVADRYKLVAHLNKHW